MNSGTKTVAIKVFIAVGLVGAAIAMAILAVWGCAPTDPEIARNTIVAPPPASGAVCDPCDRCPVDVTVVGSRMTFRLCDPESLTVEVMFTDRCGSTVSAGRGYPDMIEPGNPATYSVVVPDSAGAAGIIVYDHGMPSLFPCEWERP